MKRLITNFTLIIMILAVSGVAQAALTYRFNPNDLIDLYDQGPPLGNPDPANPRSVFTGYGGLAGTKYTGYVGIGAWNSAGYGSTMDLAIKADYLEWRDTDGGYITQFNIWLADNPKARGWGETLVIEPNTALTATSAPGWSVEVTPNQWHADLYYAEWTADNDANALKIGGPDIGDFSFTADLYVDLTENGWDETDPLAVLGQDYTIWFGGYGVGYTGHEPSGLDILFQGTLDITTVPEPATICLLGLGALSLIRRRRKA